ncbi:hypothetical protein BOX15_Mlig032107g1, partial [Macrostomum lignano]
EVLYLPRPSLICMSMATSNAAYPLKFNIISKCGTTAARTAKMQLPHATVDTPVFMPVGTKGSLKALTTDELSKLGCRIMLGNTYHLGCRPGPEILSASGGLHGYMHWPHALLTDSGGFQMVSLSKLCNIDEGGVTFTSPYDGTELRLTPEESIRIQNGIGADIMMQLDDVVHSSTTGPRVKEAMERSIRWLDRCLAANARPTQQCLFPIVQGGLDSDLRIQSLDALASRDVAGFAIGGLSGGEAKSTFWRIVKLCTERLPAGKPRYLMGVGLPLDLVVCVALGVDMFDCVLPTRTARFGVALVPEGQLQLKKRQFETDLRPIDDRCSCPCCTGGYSRAYLATLLKEDGVTLGCSLLTAHNVAYMLNLMSEMRQSLVDGKFSEFVRQFFRLQYPNPTDYPEWAVEALKSVGVSLLSGEDVKKSSCNVDGSGDVEVK